MKDAPPPRAEPPAVTLWHERTSERSLHQGSARLSIDMIALPCSLIVWLGLFLPWQAVKANASSEALPSFSFRRVFYHVASRRGHVVFLSNQSPSVASFRELNQTSRSGGICPAPRRPPGSFFSRKRGRGQPGSRPGAPGGLWHAVSDGASAGFPLCHWLLALREELLLFDSCSPESADIQSTAQTLQLTSRTQSPTEVRLQDTNYRANHYQVNVVMSTE